MEKQMNCVVKTAPGKGNLSYTTMPIPSIGPLDVLVKVKAAAICGTDIHIRDWNDWAEKRVTPPTIIGHEFAGEIVAMGELVTHVKIGDIVSAETHIACKNCELCHNGYQHVCYNTKTIGAHRNGCFAEYIAFPAENAFVCDPKLPIEIASLMEPLGAAVHAALMFPVAGKTVVVSGCGPIGLMAVAICKLVGAAKIIAVEPNAARGRMASDLGAHVIVNPMETDVVKTVQQLSGGHGADIILEFSGNVPAIKAVFLYVKPEGKIAALGLPNGEVALNMAEFVYRGITLKGIAGRKMYQTWEDMKGLLAAGLDISKVVTHVLPLTEYEKGLDLMARGECSKCILIP